MQQELIGVVVGDDDPDIGAQRRQPPPTSPMAVAHALDRRLVLGLGQREELRRMRHQRAAENTTASNLRPPQTGITSELSIRSVS